jgi:hypothetical protein
MKTIVRLLWNSIKPIVEAWLNDRALVIPAKTRQEWATKYETTGTVVLAICEEYRAKVIAQVDTLKP